jgi:hypothetical protein
MIYPTTKQPAVKHHYFNSCYYKFPSYLRRVAIMDATGQARSFNTRYKKRIDGERKHAHDKPPIPTCSTNTFPSLYQGQYIKFNKDFSCCCFYKHFIQKRLDLDFSSTQRQNSIFGWQQNNPPPYWLNDLANGNSVCLLN